MDWVARLRRKDISYAELVGAVFPIEYVDQIAHLAEYGHFHFNASPHDRGLFAVLKRMHTISFGSKPRKMSVLQ